MSEMLAISPLESSDLKPARHPATLHTKKPLVPLTVIGEEGTAKRNIIRKGGLVKARKECAPGSAMDDGSTFRDPSSLDHGDPNYDSEEEYDRGFIPDAFHVSARDDVAKSKMTLTMFKRTIEPIVTEYFVSADVDDVIRSIQDIGAPEYSYECVKRAVNMSLDKTDRERELISRLFSVGYPDTFSSNMVGKGFERLFELVDEIEKDAPSARDMLAKFLARAVVDEVLPPSFLSDPVVCNLGGDIIVHAKRMLSRDHGGGLLDRSWGPGDGRPVEEMKIAVDQCLQEYLLSSDVEEAARCIHELNSKMFYHEVVKRAVVLALDKSPEQQEQMSNLLTHLMERDQLTSSQATKGFKRLNGMISELTLDSPTAATVIAQFTARAIEDRVLPDDFKI